MEQRETAAKAIILKNKIRVLAMQCRVRKVVMVSHVREGDCCSHGSMSCADLVFFSQREITSPGAATADTG